MEYLVIFEKETGNIIDKLPSDVSIKGLNDNYDTVILDLNGSETSVGDVENGVSYIKEKILNKMSTVIYSYITIDREYDIGTQTSFLEIKMMGSTEAQNTLLTSFKTWKDSVLTTYYQCREAVKAATTVSEIYEIVVNQSALDYSSYNNSDPCVTLSSMIQAGSTE